MDIRPFGVEMWMNAHETSCRFNLAETCVHSLSVDELVALSGRGDAIWREVRDIRLTYGAIRGDDRLRDRIAGLYAHQSRDNVVTAHGTIGANDLVHRALVGQGDHVICVVPTYQQHYSIPESLRADVDLLQLQPEDGFLPDLDRLEALLRPDTKLVVINNPNNPTGALMDRAMLEDLVARVRPTGAWIVCDEVYRGLDDAGSGYTASIADLYERGISTSGMSKAYALAGLRLGWVVAPEEIVERVMQHRDYSTISVGGLDEYFACLALEHHDAVMRRSLDISRRNRRIVADWIAGEEHVSWVPPRSGTTALLKYDTPMTSEAFCLALLEEEGVLLTPGSAMGMEGWLRLGYTNPTDMLRHGLERLSSFLERHASGGNDVGSLPPDEGGRANVTRTG